MTNTTSVTAVPHLPFRRFLPHEKPVAATTRRRGFYDYELTAEQDTQPREKPPFQLLSDMDLFVLMEDRLQEGLHEDPLNAEAAINAYTTAQHEEDVPMEEAIVSPAHLPFAFEMAARGQAFGV